MRGQTKKRHISIGACVVSNVGANSESLHCDEHFVDFDTKLLLFRSKYLVAKCVFLQSSLRVTQALSAHLVVLILPGFKEFSLNWTYN